MVARAATLVVLACSLAACASPSRPLEFVGGADLVYPDGARAARVEGFVVVRYDVTADGAVVNAVVQAADPPGYFEDAALAVVRSWRFRPPVEAGEFVAAPGRVSKVRFQFGETDRYDRGAVGTAQ